MKNYFKDVRVVGNIGIPYTSMVTGSTGETVTVAEISSFQLETIDTFKPHVSAIFKYHTRSPESTPYYGKLQSGQRRISQKIRQQMITAC